VHIKSYQTNLVLAHYLSMITPTLHATHIKLHLTSQKWLNIQKIHR